MAIQKICLRDERGSTRCIARRAIIRTDRIFAVCQHLSPGDIYDLNLVWDEKQPGYRLVGSGVASNVSIYLKSQHFSGMQLFGSYFVLFLLESYISCRIYLSLVISYDTWVVAFDSNWEKNEWSDNIKFSIISQYFGYLWNSWFLMIIHDRLGS